VCVRAGRCDAAPPVFRLLDGLIYISFLSHFSV
jgi:L-lactate utilization protein LutB